ncbi:hypothetical protein GQC79_004497 [Salmonella enterica]|nr:hypothetical protein [Salmonella enterica]
MSKRLKKAICVFVLICAAGLFCALAGGVQWGTFEAGMAAFFTLLPAVIVAVAFYVQIMEE